MICKECGEDLTGQGMIAWVDHPCNMKKVTWDYNALPTIADFDRVFKSLNNDYTMNDKELLKSAAAEIKRLRKSNELMAARLDMFDAVMSALHGKPGFVQPGGFSPDVLFDIELRIAALDATEPSQQV